MKTAWSWTSPARGTPTDNALVESFNGRLRQECLNEHGSCHWPTRGA
ncbi:integrase core domain-containing protein, partial [Xanthomonas dyei]